MNGPVTLTQLQQLKADARKTEVENAWQTCLDWLKTNPLELYITRLFEVQAKARQFGLDVKPGYDGKSWIISIPEASK